MALFTFLNEFSFFQNAQGLSADMLATDLAEYLVRKGVHMTLHLTVLHLFWLYTSSALTPAYIVKQLCLLILP